MTRILIAENDRQLRREMTLVLKEGGGVEVLESENAEAALNLFKKSYYDIVITSLNLQTDLDGLGLVKRIKSISRNTIIIVLVSEHSNELIVESLKSGADDYV